MTSHVGAHALPGHGFNHAGVDGSAPWRSVGNPDFPGEYVTPELVLCKVLVPGQGCIHDIAEQDVGRVGCFERCTRGRTR